VSTRQELREAHDQTEIADEIYKASLETITRLEHEATVSRRNASRPEEAAQATPISGARSPVSTEHGVDESEHERVKSLCASFQEQCLWRSIETAESEKRNLQLEARLNDALNEKTAMAERLDASQRELQTTQEEARKLKAHRAVLVQEVKRLQPYSQVNLTALVQEAQEARMMQRSLQAQLDMLRGSGGVSPEDTKTTSENGGTGGYDGADTDFVVVSSSPTSE
jgi:predicted phage-related endonuclease